MQPLSGLGNLGVLLPRVATENGGPSQPWADMRNPFGVFFRDGELWRLLTQGSDIPSAERGVRSAECRVPNTRPEQGGVGVANSQSQIANSQCRELHLANSIVGQDRAVLKQEASVTHN